MTDPSLDLVEVQQAFREAQAKLVELSAAADGLQSVSGQLSDAQAAVVEGSRSVADLASANAELAKRMASAAAAIEQVNPEEINGQLGSISEQVDLLVKSVADARQEASDRVEAVRAATEESADHLAALQREQGDAITRLEKGMHEELAGLAARQQSQSRLLLIGLLLVLVAVASLVFRTF